MTPEHREKTPPPPPPPSGEHHSTRGKSPPPPPPPPARAGGRGGRSPPPRDVHGGRAEMGVPSLIPGLLRDAPPKPLGGRKQGDRAAPLQLLPCSSSPRPVPARTAPQQGAARQPSPLTFARDAVWGSPIKNHPLKQRVVVDVLLRPRSGQAAGLAALLLAEVGFVEDLAAAVPRLPEPAVPSCGGGDDGRGDGRGRGRGTGGSGGRHPAGSVAVTSDPDTTRAPGDDFY